MDNDRLLLDPKVFSDALRRDIIKIVCNKYDADLKFVEVPSDKYRRGFRKGYFQIVSKKGKAKIIKQLLEGLGIRLVSRFEDASGYFEEGVIDYMKIPFTSGVPIGVSKDFNRLVMISFPSNIIVREPITALYLSLLTKRSIWIGKLFKGYDEFFELIDGLPISSIPRSRLVDLSEYLVSRTLGRRELVSVLEKFFESSESLLEDVEIPLSDDVERLLSEIFSWGCLKREGELDCNRCILDASELSSLAIDLTVLTSMLLGFESIVSAYPNVDRRVLRYLNSNQSFIVIDNSSKLEEPFQILIDSDKGELIRRFNVMGKDIYKVENFIPIWNIFKVKLY